MFFSHRLLSVFMQHPPIHNDGEDHPAAGKQPLWRCQTFPALICLVSCQIMTNNIKHLKTISRGYKKIDDECVLNIWFSRNVLHVWERGFPVLILLIILETVLSWTSIPSYISSPCISGAPQRGFALAISWISLRVSGAIDGLRCSTASFQVFLLLTPVPPSGLHDAGSPVPTLLQFLPWEQ